RRGSPRHSSGSAARSKEHSGAYRRGTRKGATMTPDNEGEVVATRPRRKMKPRGRWKIHRRPGGGELDTEAELARKLGELQRTVRTWRLRGVIPHIRIGHKTIRYRLGPVLNALAKRESK